MTMRKRQGILMWDLISQNSPFPGTLPGKGLNIRSIYFSLGNAAAGQCADIVRMQISSILIKHQYQLSFLIVRYQLYFFRASSESASLPLAVSRVSGAGSTTSSPGFQSAGVDTLSASCFWSERMIRLNSSILRPVDIG